MRQQVIVLMLAAAAVAGTAVAQGQPGNDSSENQRNGETEVWAKLFNDPERDDWQKPLTVMPLLALDKGHRVACIGPAAFYFMRRLSIKVGEAGRIYAVSTDAEVLEQVREQDGLSPVDNIVTILADPDNPQLPRGELDQVLLVNVWHRTDSRPNYLRKLARALKPSGRLTIVDWSQGALPMGPPPETKIDRDTVLEEANNGGWTLVTESVALPYQYFLVFLPPEKR